MHDKILYIHSLTVTCKYRPEASFNIHIKESQNRGKCDLGDFNHDADVCARWAGLSVSESADLIGHSHKMV